nr:hypothetical protein [Lysobacter psychrotolerans]
MSPIGHCPNCGCRDAGGTAVHAVVAALLDGDVDAALERGLLVTPACLACDGACTAVFANARGERQRALAARERYRERATRLQRRADERAQRRQAGAGAATGPASEATQTPQAPAPRPALPSAAAAALARAKARAAGQEPR